MPRIPLILALLSCVGFSLTAQSFQFRLDQPAEVVAGLEMSSPGSDWAEPGREAAVAAVSLNGSYRAHVTLYAGAQRYRYSVFLGTVGVGEHRLEVARDPQHSAAGSGLEVAGASFREYRRGDPYFSMLASAPVLYARPDTIGRFSDLPLLCYCERLEEDGRPLLQYTMIYSNEDGGTSTRALMARWGRTTDIDYVYKAYLDGRERVRRATIQGQDHKEIEFRGQREGTHPVLIVSTQNNMIAQQGRSAIRYQIAPIAVDLAEHSREQVMDQHPVTWQVMAQELRREAKLRPFGMLDEEKISDPRNYLYLEAKVANRDSGVAVLVRRQGEQVWRSSNLGRMDYAISRNGWVRTAVELPPGSQGTDLAEIGFECQVVRPDKAKWPHSGVCRIQAVSKSFFLMPDYTPGPTVWTLPAGSGVLVIPSGEMRRFEPEPDAQK